MLIKAFTDAIEDLTTLVESKINRPYWIKISTIEPKCIYYFGPFSSYPEARQMQNGYVEDLMSEQAVGISVKIERCMPTKLTIYDEEESVSLAGE